MVLSKDLELFMNYRRMRNVRRCNTLPTVNSVDVAQHSYYVTILAMIFTDEYNTWAEEHNLNIDNAIPESEHLTLLKSEVVIRKALLHDTEESFTSDIPWNIKHMNDEVHELFENAINQCVDKAYKGTKTMELYHKLGKECKDGFEGQVVDLADMTELAIYCWEEVSMGNHYMKPMLDKCISLIQDYPIAITMIITSPMFNDIWNMLRLPTSDIKDTVEDLLNIK